MAKKDYLDMCTTQEQELNFQFLDRRNLAPYIKDKTKLNSVVREVEEVYDSCLQLPKCCKGNTFNFITPKQFGKYLENKYKVKVERNVVYLVS